MANAVSLRKSTVGTFYVFLVFLVLLMNCICFATFIAGWSTIPLLTFCQSTI